MAIEFRAKGTTARNTTAAATINVSYPASVAADELLVLHIVTDNAAVTTPGGWTAVVDDITADPGGGLWIKKAAGTETGSLAVSYTSATATAHISVFTGVDTTTPQDATASTVTGTGTSIVCPSINTVTANTMLILGAGQEHTAQSTYTASAGTEIIDYEQESTTGDLAGALYYQAVAGTGATGTRTITASASALFWGGMMVLRPASGSGTNASAGNASGTGAVDNDVWACQPIGHTA